MSNQDYSIIDGFHFHKSSLDAFYKAFEIIEAGFFIPETLRRVFEHLASLGHPLTKSWDCSGKYGEWWQHLDIETDERKGAYVLVARTELGEKILDLFDAISTQYQLLY